MTKDLYSIAINGNVVAENMTLQFAAAVTAALADTDSFYWKVEEIAIKRVKAGDE